MTGLRKFTSKDLGGSKEDIEVTTESNVLVVKSKKDKKVEEEYLHKGVSSRTFARGFNLSDDVEIGTVTFNNGLLVIELRRIIPDHQKHKVYEIQNSALPEGDADASSDAL